MELSTLITIVILVVIVGYVVTIYNGLVTLKHQVKTALSNIDVILVQRHDELPKLVATCKQYMGYEQETLERVVQARSQVFSANKSGDMKQLGAAESQLRQGLGQLFALAESYPELKADQQFTLLQTRVVALESSISDRREVYNESVNNNNVRIEQFPDVLIARAFNFEAATLLEFEEEQKTDVNLDKLFG